GANPDRGAASRKKVKTHRSAILFLLSSIGLSAAPSVHYSFWVEPCTNPESACQSGDPQLAEWALKAWQNASEGALDLTRAEDPAHAQIRIIWATAEQGMYGEARPIQVDGKRGAVIYVRPAPLQVN